MLLLGLKLLLLTLLSLRLLLGQRLGLQDLNLRKSLLQNLGCWFRSLLRRRWLLYGGNKQLDMRACGDRCDMDLEWLPPSRLL